MTRLLEIPNPQRRAIEVIKEVSAEKACRPFLVGGPVRDLLLGRHGMDVDLTLEDGSSTLARALAKRIEGRVRSFPQFLTYKVTAEDFPEIDIATARSEKYRQAGALPAVSEGSLADDLLRRDFSINAIAFDVIHGQLHDPTGGQRDLESQTVRVLHDLSFIDDPTRIFRAIRLGTRLGFTLEPATEGLMKAAIAAGALATVSKERLWRELFLAFEEERAADVVAALHRAGALEVLFGRREIEREWLERSQRVANANPSLDRQALFLSAILNGNASPVDMEGSGLSQQRQRVVVQIANEAGRFSDAVIEAATDRARFKVLKKASPELLAVLPPEQVGKYREFLNFRIPLRGTDLDVTAGPHIARALEKAREAVFLGEIPADEARTFARELAIKYLDKSETS